MQIGEITSHIDVAQLVFWAFMFFFFGLIFYLRGEDRREGYPLVPQGNEPPDADHTRWIWIPKAKTFDLPHGGQYHAPSGHPDRAEIKARDAAPWAGAPIVPTGDPMKDGVGPAAWAPRRDEPELTIDGVPLIQPLRAVKGAMIAREDPDPRGMTVVGADNRPAGEVTDVWVDISEPQVRYLEVGITGGRTVLLPMTLARVDRVARRVRAASILAAQFADVPAHKSPDHVTKLEEDKICAYYASGHLYAEPRRLGPIL